MQKKKLNPKYPVYVPTKGRFKSRLTSKILEKIKVPYYLVIEPQEKKLYAKVVRYGKILVLPWSKPNSSTELVKTRNWIKQHSISNGDKRHWQIDDNIRDFYRMNRNLKVRVTSGTIFRVAEDFVDRYENVAIAGFNYELLKPRLEACPPFQLNTRVYSMSLILNSIPYEWRGIYNDDTDICLRALKGGWCTILFNAFLCDKMGTMRVKGGNTPIYMKDEEFDGRLEMAKSLQQQHPELVKVTRKWGRWQHHIDYKIFRKNKLKKKPDVVIPEGVNNYGMQLEMLKEGEWTKINL
jgi:hypothetical protein